MSYAVKNILNKRDEAQRRHEELSEAYKTLKDSTDKKLQIADLRNPRGILVWLPRDVLLTALEDVLEEANAEYERYGEIVAAMEEAAERIEKGKEDE